jgi:outer membrane protein assembly factor BamE (lipoprotein component of BamABCDE complex)
MNAHLSRVAAAIVACSLPVLSGCLINTHSQTEFSGRYIGAETMAQIEPGKTKEDFIVATLGTPTSKTTLGDGSQVWKYEYRKRTSGSGSVFLLLNSSNSTDKEGAVYVLLKEGVVQKAWRD